MTILIIVYLVQVCSISQLTKLSVGLALKIEILILHNILCLPWLSDRLSSDFNIGNMFTGVRDKARITCINATRACLYRYYNWFWDLKCVLSCSLKYTHSFLVQFLSSELSPQQWSERYFFKCFFFTTNAIVNFQN